MNTSEAPSRRDLTRLRYPERGTAEARTSSIARVPMVALFTSITVAFALIAVWTISAGRYPIGLAAAALAAWMGTLAWSALRRMRS